MQQNNKDIILQEELDAGLKHALYSNFSNYLDAFLELVDNAVGNRIPGLTLHIDILASNKNVEIKNSGGYGMNIQELDEFLKWGKIKTRRLTDLGAYSQGGKSAMGYLGRSMFIIASPRGEKVAYRLEDDDLHDYKIKKYRVMPLPCENLEGYVKIEVGKLGRKFKDDEVKTLLLETYRPLIEKNEVTIEYNGEKLKIKPFPIQNKLRDFSFGVKNASNKFGEVKGWIAYLIPKSGLKGGLRCYKLGRLICDKEFFSRYDASYKQTLNFLFGEVHLNHVPVTTNKTDFDRDSSEWTETQDKMYEILKPYIDELLGRDIQEPSEEEKERVVQARNIMAEIMKLREKELKGVGIIHDISLGQKPRGISIEKEKKQKNTILTGRKNEPRTPPPPSAKGKRKRLKEFMDWNIRPMEETLRSKIELDEKGHKLLIINNLFPGFRAAKGNLIYLLESAAIQLAKPDSEEKIKIGEYISDFDELYSFICDNLDLAKENLKKKKLDLKNKFDGKNQKK